MYRVIVGKEESGRLSLIGASIFLTGFLIRSRRRNPITKEERANSRSVVAYNTFLDPLSRWNKERGFSIRAATNVSREARLSSASDHSLSLSYSRNMRVSDSFSLRRPTGMFAEACGLLLCSVSASRVALVWQRNVSFLLLLPSPFPLPTSLYFTVLYRDKSATGITVLYYIR